MSGTVWCLVYCLRDCFGANAKGLDERENVRAVMECNWEDEAVAALPSLPGLRADELATKGRAFYRNRQYTELEPARCYGSGAGPAEASIVLS